MDILKKKEMAQHSPALQERCMQTGLWNQRALCAIRVHTFSQRPQCLLYHAWPLQHLSAHFQLHTLHLESKAFWGNISFPWFKDRCELYKKKKKVWNIYSAFCIDCKIQFHHYWICIFVMHWKLFKTYF